MVGAARSAGWKPQNDRVTFPSELPLRQPAPAPDAPMIFSC